MSGTARKRSAHSLVFVRMVVSQTSIEGRSVMPIVTAHFSYWEGQVTLRSCCIIRTRLWAVFQGVKAAFSEILDI